MLLLWLIVCLIDWLIDWLFISWQGRLIEAVMNDNETEALDCVNQGADCNRVNKVSCLFLFLFFCFFGLFVCLFV